MAKGTKSTQPVKKQSTLFQFAGFDRGSDSSEQASKKKENTCEFCLKTFQHLGAQKSHKLFCKENPMRMATTKEHCENLESEDANSSWILPIFDDVIDNICKESTPGGWRFSKIRKNTSQMYEIFGKR